MNFLKKVNEDAKEDQEQVANDNQEEEKQEVREEPKEEPYEESKLEARAKERAEVNLPTRKYFSPQIGRLMHKKVPPLISQDVFLIGVCGGPSCGKTTLVEYIKTSLGRSIACIKCSDFYIPLLGNQDKKIKRSTSYEQEIENMTEGDKKDQCITRVVEKINKEYDFDSPSAIDFEMLRESLNLLKKRVPASIPKYNKKTKRREDKFVTVEPCDVVIVEGHLIFADKELQEMFNLKIYVDADDDVRLSRRILKEMNEEIEGKFDIFKFLEKYEKFVKPAHEKYVEPTKKYADVVIPNYGFTIEELNIEKQFVCKPALDLIIKEIKTRTGFE